MLLVTELAVRIKVAQIPTTAAVSRGGPSADGMKPLSNSPSLLADHSIL